MRFESAGVTVVDQKDGNSVSTNVGRSMKGIRPEYTAKKSTRYGLSKCLLRTVETIWNAAVDWSGVAFSTVPQFRTS